MSWQLVVSNDPMLRSGSCHLSSQPSQMASQPAQGNKKKNEQYVSFFFGNKEALKNIVQYQRKKAA